MQPANFGGLCHHIENHAISQNESGNPQIRPRYQLVIFLYRLGNPGGVSHEDTSTLLGLGEGTVSLYSNRVLETLESLNFIRLGLAVTLGKSGVPMLSGLRRGKLGTGGKLDGKRVPLRSWACSNHG